jgi:hypothetical protein
VQVQRLLSWGQKRRRAKKQFRQRMTRCIKSSYSGKLNLASERIRRHYCFSKVKMLYAKDINIKQDVNVKSQSVGESFVTDNGKHKLNWSHCLHFGGCKSGLPSRMPN